jgi:hypothetical protein
VSGRPLRSTAAIARSTSNGVRRSSSSSPRSAQYAATSPSKGMPTEPALIQRRPPMRRSSCMCVCPATTASASTPATIVSRRASDVIGVTISSSLRGVA